jgi:hypothetical protein
MQETSIMDKVHIFREVLIYKFQIFIMVNNYKLFPPTNALFIKT